MGHSHTTTTPATPSSNPAFDDANASNLVGLWDFASTAPTADTGLADNIAQNGHLHGAHITGDRLVTDGSHDYFDVSGADAPFDLDVGTIAVQFTQADHVGTSPDVIVNRGEFHDMNSEGWFGIKVTADGQVIVQHCPIGPDGTRIDAFINTAAGFFNEGETVKVTYSWDAATGGTAVIENVTTGATYTESVEIVGLTMEIGDNDDENFTFGAREANDGSYDEFFDGTIDYVAIYNTDTINTPAGEGIVEGTDGNDLIDVNYNGDPDGDFIDNNDALIGNIGSNDDIVVAGAGDDTVLAGLGNDSVLGGSGNDTIEGGADNDLIYGDNGAQTTLGGGTPTVEGIADEGGVATLLVWDASQLSFTGGDPFPNGTSGLSTSSVDDITMTINTDATPVAVGINDGSSSHFNDGDTSQDLVNKETIDGITGTAGTRFTPEYAYSVVNDDTGETIKVYAVEMNSNQVVGFVSDAPMELGATYSFVSNISSYRSVPYGDLADTYIDPNGGVVVVDASDDGDDVIDGGTGEDTIFGEGGNDTIDGGADDDLIFGDNGSANPGGSVVGSPSLMDIDNLSGGILTSNDGSVSAQVGLDDFSVVPAGTLNATSDVFYAERISGTDQATLSFDF